MVLKLWSEVDHAQDRRGGVILNVADDAAVRAAFAQIKENARHV